MAKLINDTEFKMKVKFYMALYLIIFSTQVFSEEYFPKMENSRYLVIGDNVNVREKPNLKSNPIEKLRLLSIVQLIKRSEIKEKIGNFEGRWVYIDTNICGKNCNETIKGWVFDYFLSDGSNFKKVSTFKRCLIEGNVGDTLISIDIFDDGKYNRKRIEYDTDKLSYHRGQLYKFRNVIIARDNKGDFYLPLYLRKDGVLCSMHSDGNGNQICAKEVSK